MLCSKYTKKPPGWEVVLFSSKLTYDVNKPPFGKVKKKKKFVDPDFIGADKIFIIKDIITVFVVVVNIILNFFQLPSNSYSRIL